jgi:hypothetical protein
VSDAFAQGIYLNFVLRLDRNDDAPRILATLNESEGILDIRD